MTPPDPATPGVIDQAKRRHIAVLNKLESHLGCVVCRGPLDEGRCPTCQSGASEGGDHG